MVRPLALELESIKRTGAENNALLAVLEKAAKATPAEPEAFGQINQQLQRLGAVETANQKLFDALHTELKGYKDNFLFDALQRPFIRDLVSIFDDFTAVHDQVSKRLRALENGQGGATSPANKAAEPRLGPAGKTAEDPSQQTEADFLRTLAGNMDNEVHHLLEIFLRLEVVLSQSPAGTPLDKRLHRTVAFEPAPHAGHDAQVVRSLKPGFTWRERMIRPEEVVVHRWLAEPTTSAPPENHDFPLDSKPGTQPENRRPGADAKLGKPK